MSHHATNWAIQQRGLKPVSKIVLWHLADCHNPAQGCFPSLDYLAHHAEIGLTTVKEHLNALELAGLIKRVRMKDEKTRKQLPTRYVLAFEAHFEATESNDAPGARTPENPDTDEASRGRKPAPETGAGNDQKPGPDSGESRGRIPAPNLVREPVKEPSRARDDAAPDGASSRRDGAPPGDRESSQRAQRYAVKLVIGWARADVVERLPAKLAGQSLRFDLSGPEARDFVFSLDRRACRRAASLIRWGLAIVDGEDDKPPKQLDMPALIEGLRHPIAGAAARARCEAFLAFVALAHPPRDDDPPADERSEDGTDADCEAA